MAYIYYRLIKSGVRTLQQVPTHLRPEVQVLLNADISGE